MRKSIKKLISGVAYLVGLFVCIAVGQTIFEGKAFDLLPSSGPVWTFVGTYMLMQLALFVMRWKEEGAANG